jgi:hypothetical protein
LDWTQTEEERDKAIQEINTSQAKYRNHEVLHPLPHLCASQLPQIYAGVRSDNKRERPNKRSHDTDTDSKNKKMRATTEVTNINDVVCPWWAMPYDEQLAKKEAAMREECITKIKSKLRSSYFEANDNRRKNKQTMLKLPDWLEKSAGHCPSSSLPLYDHLMAPTAPIPLHPILASPETIGNYRNKCEFTFGYAAEDVATTPSETQDPAPENPPLDSEAIATTEAPASEVSSSPSPSPSLGFRVSSYKDGLLVASPETCPHIPFPMVEIVKIFIRHLKGSALKVYDQYQHNGVWRLLTVRYSERTNQLILMLCVSLKGVDEEIWRQEKQALVEILSQATIYPSSSASLSPEAVPVVIKGFQLQVRYCSIDRSDSGDRSTMASLSHSLTILWRRSLGMSVPSSLATFLHSLIALLALFLNQDYIVEQMNGCQFQVSPQAFFQVPPLFLRVPH